MRSVVPGTVSGKTGTSRKASASGYASRYIATFAGFAPSSDPRLVGVVVINDPSGDQYFGGLVAAATAQETGASPEQGTTLILSESASREVEQDGSATGPTADNKRVPPSRPSAAPENPAWDVRMRAKRFGRVEQS